MKQENVKKRIGLVINPIAGIGGKAGFKGSDGEEIQKAALEKGIRPEASDKARIALNEILSLKDNIEIISYGGEMGQKIAENMGFTAIAAGGNSIKKTTAEDTKEAIKKICEYSPDLIVFAGGDGTARDVCSVLRTGVPVIGIPAGVKIHSGVYAVNPKCAGTAIKQFLFEGQRKVKEAEVMDLDEAMYRQGIISPKLYGYMYIPDNSKKMQNRKTKSISYSDSLDYIASDIINSMKDDTFYIIGAGTTTRNIMLMLKCNYSLIGVDSVYNKNVVELDMDELQLWDMVNSHKCSIVVTAIGGQGHIFGRGNQQISPRVIRKVGRENITVIATKEKLLALDERKLLVDTGDPELDVELSGYTKVVTGLNERTICMVGTEK